jgi:hypothetical protein
VCRGTSFLIVDHFSPIFLTWNSPRIPATFCVAIVIEGRCWCRWIPGCGEGGGEVEGFVFCELGSSIGAGIWGFLVDILIEFSLFLFLNFRVYSVGRSHVAAVTCSHSPHHAVGPPPPPTPAPNKRDSVSGGGREDVGTAINCPKFRPQTHRW